MSSLKTLKTIFVTGGVVSSLGKGISAAILSGLLASKGFKTKLKKIDPYLNVDPGTLSPLEHGEVFVTMDGMEADLDLGHYERLGATRTSRTDYITSGSIYQKLISKERQGLYNGKTVQVVPHFTNELKEAIFAGTDDIDFLICEVGGTVGDIENIAILETIRQIKFSCDDVICIHVALMPYLEKAQEWKTKTIQHSVRNLLSYGIQTDLLLCRMSHENLENWKEKLALLTNIKQNSVFAAIDAPSTYHAMLAYDKEGVCSRVLEIFGIPERSKNLQFLTDYVAKLESSLPILNVAIVGKYVQCKDSYKSVEEAIYHAAAFNSIHAKIHIIDAETFDDSTLHNIDAIFIPGGFGQRAVEGKMAAMRFAHKYNIPCLGMCFALQLMIIDALRTLYSDATSMEFDSEAANPVIIKLSEWIKENQVVISGYELGGSMRLGSYPCHLIEGSLAWRAYGKSTVHERHRHRYIFNNKYKDDLEKVGIAISGYNDDGQLEVIERKDCDFFITCQFHAEFESTIRTPHPLFIAFLQAAKRKSKASFL